MLGLTSQLSRRLWGGVTRLLGNRAVPVAALAFALAALPLALCERAQAQAAPNVITSTLPFLNPSLIPVPGYVTLENATVPYIGTGLNGPEFRINFGASPSRFKQVNLTSPINLASRDQLTWVITNHENRTVNIVIVFQVLPNLNDYTGSMTYQMVLAPNSTTRYLINYFTPNPAQWYLKAFPKPYDTPYTVIGPPSNFNRSTIYAWRFSNIDPAPASVTIADFSTLTYRRDLDNVADEFFQYAYRDWPGKTHSEDDLVNDAYDEMLDLATHPGQMDTDGSAYLPNQGVSDHWRIGQINGKYYFITPGGAAFWSFGLQGMHDATATWIDGRESFFKSLPSQTGPDADCYQQQTRYTGVGGQTVTAFKCVKYNLKRKFGPGYFSEWLYRARLRVRSWGFNTVGPFCLDSLYTPQVPYCLMLDTFDFPTRITTAPQVHWMTMPDPYAPDFESWMTEKFTRDLQGHLGVPTFMGVFVDNEQSWGHTQDTNLNNRYTLAMGALAAPYTQPCKQALIAFLTSRYQSITLLNAAWGTSFASWSQLRDPYVQNANSMGKEMKKDIQEYTRRFSATYHAKVRRALTAAGMHELYLGCRFWNYTPETVAGSLPYVDALSFNNYSLDNAYPWSYLASLNKPILISEWSNPCNLRGSIGWSQMTQQENYDAIVQYFTSALRKPYIIGVHWYETYDSPVTGISGSNWNVGFGMVDVTDKPKPEVVAATRYIGDNMYYIRTAP